jgi:hypothetical protein
VKERKEVKDMIKTRNNLNRMRMKVIRVKRKRNLWSFYILKVSIRTQKF